MVEALLALVALAVLVLALITARSLDRLTDLEERADKTTERAVFLEARLAGLERQSGRWIGPTPITDVPSPRARPEEQPDY